MAGVAGIDDINLWAPVNPDGSVNQVVTPENNREETKGTSKLGKDAFLNLLVAQMKYQDPLNPTSDTEWIAQMATFSTLEEMQNMNTTMGNSQALSLVGKTVLINSNDKLVGGKVDYVVMQAGKAYLAVNEKLYSIDDLDTVASEEYLKKLEEAGTVNKPEDKEEDKTDTDKTEEDKEDDKTDAQKILDSLTGLGTKLDAMGDAITKAAESMADAADVISGMADSSQAASTREEAGQFVSGSNENKDTTENKVENVVEDSAATAAGAVGTDTKTEGTEGTETKEVGTEDSVAQDIVTE